MAGYTIISADSHVAEPPELYTELVAPEFRHRTPKIIQENGATYRVVEGRKRRRLDLAEARLTEEDREKGVPARGMGRAEPGASGSLRLSGTG